MLSSFSGWLPDAKARRTAAPAAMDELTTEAEMVLFELEAARRAVCRNP